MADDRWHSPTFRQSIVNKINEVVSTKNWATSKSASEMENHVFNKANSKDEYLGSIAQLILHIVLESRNKNQLQQQGGGSGLAVGGGGGADGVVGGQVGMEAGSNSSSIDSRDLLAEEVEKACRIRDNCSD